jgi:prevent-host-death family protein
MLMKVMKHAQDWTIAEARRGFSELLSAASREPQRVFNRANFVAAVVDADDFEEFERWRELQHQRSLADDFEDLRRICREEAYELQVPSRSDRKTPFGP